MKKPEIPRKKLTVTYSLIFDNYQSFENFFNSIKETESDFYEDLSVAHISNKKCTTTTKYNGVENIRTIYFGGIDEA